MIPLKKIQRYVKQYAEVIANILQCEVEIMDENLIRIAGTGYFEKKVGKKCEGSVYPHVFLTEESHIITNPKENELCMKCTHRESCTEELEISSPIFYKGKVVGVIGLVCFNVKDRDRILENIQFYLKFTEQISDFISGKLFELEGELEKKERVDILKKIVNTYDKGVIILDDKGNIVDINDGAKERLRLNNEGLIGYPKINIIPKKNMVNDQILYSLEIEENKYTFQGTITSFESLSSKEYKIFIFEYDDRETSRLKENIEKLEDAIIITNIIGNNEEIKEIKETIKKIADSPSTVLIIGESGTGKELVARAIHSCGDRANYPFVAINCGAIPENLLESELFGYVRGAFSGATNEGRAGKFELANNGIIFLDEIGEMPLSLQVKLLRVLQERKIERLGSNKTIDLNIRVIAATNADLEILIEEKKFRRDLYYRLNVLQLELPPLRERKEDIPLLLNNLINKYSIKFNKNPLKLKPDLLSLFKNYSWPGNVRELENIVEYLVNMQDDMGNIGEDIVKKIERKFSKKTKDKNNILKGKNISTLEDLEKEMIKQTLEKHGTSKEGKDMCAKELGIGIATLYRKIEKYNL